MSMDFNQFIGGDGFHLRHPYGGNPYYWEPYHAGINQAQPYPEVRQGAERGQATWTEGGQYTKCGIPWSHNEFMTVAVGENSPYRCGKIMKVSSPETGREIYVTVVDEVQGYPANRINLHRRAFEALGVNLDAGVLEVQVAPASSGDPGNMARKLEEVVRLAFPNASIRSYQPIDRRTTEAGNAQERSDFIIEVNGQRKTVRGEIIYHPGTEEMISMNLYQK